MKVYNLNTIHDLQKDSHECFVTIGFFDGVHKGHQMIINKCVKEAKKLQKQATVITFCDEWITFLKRNVSLCSLDLKLHALEKLGVDTVYVIGQQSDILKMSAISFIEQILIPIHCLKIFCGNDFCFGSDLKGIETLKNHFQVQVIQDKQIDNQKLSSTLLESWLKQGKVELVNQYLFFPFTIVSKVVKGKQLGRKLACKTANLEKVHPSLKNGVYFGKVCYQNRWYRAMINVGYNPTVDHDQQRKIEVHIQHFNQDIYGKDIVVVFYIFHREEHKFASIDELKSQLEYDKQQLRIVKFSRKHKPC